MLKALPILAALLSPSAFAQVKTPPKCSVADLRREVRSDLRKTFEMLGGILDEGSLALTPIVPNSRGEPFLMATSRAKTPNKRDGHLDTGVFAALYFVDEHCRITFNGTARLVGPRTKGE